MSVSRKQRQSIGPEWLRLRTRLAEACARLDPAEERALAEEGLAADLASWPRYENGCEHGLNATSPA